MANKNRKEERMSPRTGRPTNNPKNERIAIRLDAESAKTLEKYCEQEKINQAEAARRGIKKLKTDLKE
jgi:hypothetical protein